MKRCVWCKLKGKIMVKKYYLISNYYSNFYTYGYFHPWCVDLVDVPLFDEHPKIIEKREFYKKVEDARNAYIKREVRS